MLSGRFTQVLNELDTLYCDANDTISHNDITNVAQK